MILNIYSIRDMKTDMFGNPMFLFNDGHAVRSVADEVNRGAEGGMFAAHPEDFELFHLGTFDTQTAEFVTAKPRSVVLLSGLTRK